MLEIVEYADQMGDTLRVEAKVDDRPAWHSGVYFHLSGDDDLRGNVFVDDPATVERIRDRLSEWLEATKPKLPTLPHAVIRARMPSGDAVVLSHVDPQEPFAWRAIHAPTRDGMWYGADDIQSFEVLFEGVED